VRMMKNCIVENVSQFMKKAMIGKRIFFRRILSRESSLCWILLVTLWCWNDGRVADTSVVESGQAVENPSAFRGLKPVAKNPQEVTVAQNARGTYVMVSSLHCAKSPHDASRFIYSHPPRLRRWWRWRI